MTTKKSKKGKTMALTDFLAEGPKTVTVRTTTNWSEIVDSEEAETKPIVVDIGALPTAPRGPSIVDPSTISNNPPFVAHVANLSFEIDDEGLRRIFADLNPKSARVLRDGIRSRGVGLVEFETRDNLIDGLKRTDKEIYGRKIRITVSDKADTHQTDSGRGTFGNNRSNRGGGGGGERPEMEDRWKRAEPRSDDTPDDRSSGGFNRDRQNRGDHGRSNMGSGSRDNHGNDYGFGYPRARDDRGEGHSRGGGGGGGNRDFNRQGQRNRNYDDDNRSNSGVDRPRYSGRYSDTRDTRDRNPTNEETRDDQREPPRERQRLQLQPRTKPLEEFEPLSGSSSSVNNVAANAGQSSISNADDSSSSIANTSTQQNQDSSINENRDDDQQQQQQESRNSNDQVNTSDEQSTVKPSRGAGASIFGGAKPVDTTAREREIEKKLKELQLTSSETTGDTEEKTSSSRPSNYRGDREGYSGKRSSYNDDHRDRDRDRDRDRRDDGRSGHGTDYHHKREYSGGRQYEDEGRRRPDDDHAPRRGGQDRDRYGGNGSSRRDHESGRTNKQNQPERDLDHDWGNNRNREDRTHDPDEFSTYGRSSNNNNADSFTRNQQRGPRRTIQTEDDSNKLQLSNKFCMLNDDVLDAKDENDEVQSPTIDE